MAGNTIDMELKLKTNLESETSQAKLLNRELDRARKGGPVTAAAARSENVEYGRGRGTMGATGASARDFANQAQGLGGLVRLYATVAANTFAATAAFNALKQAMDTTSMVEGLNQLGAASGTSLGTLSKRFVDVTDGAISFREAAQAAAKATSAGLSSRQFLQIGDVAKRAAQALGVDMGDAVNRLTRGITKLEPELLDELGIYTKIGPATEEYARKVGKAASSLTDFERRQAFANAVIEEGNKKFSEIQIATNPYQKLAASIQNLTQVGLEFINKFLGPIASLFANNSTLLVAALAGIAAKLVGTAIPALRGWQDQLRKSAEDAKIAARDINISFGEFGAAKLESKKGIPELTARLRQTEEIFNQSRERLLQIEKDSGEKRRSVIYKSLDVTDVGRDSERVRRIQRSMQAEISKLTAIGSDPATSAKQTQYAQQRVSEIELQKKALQDYISVAKQVRDVNDQIEKEASKFNLGDLVRSRISKQAASKAERLNIVAAVSEDVERSGFVSALGEMNKKISSSTNMGAFTKFRTVITGTFAAATTGVGMFLRAFGPWGQVLALAGAGLAALDSIASTNTKQMEMFTREVELNKDTIANSTRVIAKYKDAQITTEMFTAAGTAINDLSESVDNLTTSFKNAQGAQGAWDRFKDNILSIFNSSLKQDFASSVAQNWMQQINMLPEGELKSAAIEKLKSVFNITDVSIKSLREAINQSKSAEKAAAEGSKALEPSREAVTELGRNAGATKESIDKLNKSSLDLQNTFRDQSPIGKFAEDLINAAQNIKNSFNDIGTSVAALKEILAKPGAFALIDLGSLNNIKQAVAAQEKVLNLQKERQKLQEQLPQAQAELDRILANPRLPKNYVVDLPEERTARTDPLYGIKREAFRAAQKVGGLTVQIQEIDKAIEETTKTGFKGLFENIRNIITNSFKQGFKLLNESLEIAKKQATLQVQKTIVSGVSGLGMADITANLSQVELDLQKQQLDTTGKLVDQLLLNTIAREEANALEQEALIAAKQQKGETLTAREQAQLTDLPQTRNELALLRASLAPGGAALSAETIAGFTPQAAGVGLQAQLNRTGRAAQIAGLEGRSQSVEIERRINLLREEQLIETDIQNTNLKTIEYRQKLTELQRVGFGTLSEQQLVAAQSVETEKLKQTQRIAILAQEQKIQELQQRQTEELKRNGYEENQLIINLGKNIGYQTERLNLLKQQQGQESNILRITQEQARIRAGFAKEAQNRKDQLDTQESISRVVETELESQQQLLEYANSRGRLTADEYAQNKASLELRRLELDQAAKVRQIEDTRTTGLADIEQTKQLYLSITGQLSNEDAEALEERTNRVNNAAEREIAVLRRVQQVKKEGILLQIQETDRQKAYEDTFKNTFSGLADAMVEWAQKGKWAGKDLINSLLADLLRYELRLQMFQLYSAARPGLLNLFGFSSGGGGVATTSSGIPLIGDFSTGAGTMMSAKGSYFDGNMAKFAKGGMFTNSIVNQPTLFKFAKGTGLMGEAGPEAIMPLRRDGNGNLGVIGQQGKTQVVINNYSGERAESKETVDSRGNRKIEVVIGEAAALDLSTAGSSSQKSLRSTFGLAPQLIRR